MNPQTEHLLLPGPAGALECAIDGPAAPVGGAAHAAVGIAVICHPHPQHGGTMDNKVVQTLARAFVQLGYRTVRFNFRGVGQSAGAWDEGRGELDDALAVVQAQVQAQVQADLPLVLAGFSFGAYIAATAAQQLQGSAHPVQRLALVGPAASRFDLPTVPADTLVVHGETDDVVPLAAVFDWARPQSLPVVVVPGTGHFFHGQLALLKTLVLRAWA